ncbi:MAG: methyltransferase domain-containing protein, partial [Chloroflexota bacterium]|nr:methyltransferase domain-containing protein [Chloroflexota bacterium]
SGTLLIERAAAAPATRIIGLDIGPHALECAARNIAASGYGDRIELHRWDACHLPLPDRSVDALCADLPFGHIVGSAAKNRILYPRIMCEAARIARSGALFCALTHQVRLLEAVLRQSGGWTVERDIRVGLGGVYPRLFVLRRTGSP